MFEYHQKLHHPQTVDYRSFRSYGFEYYQKLHHSQTGSRGSAAEVGLSTIKNHITLKPLPD